MEGAQINENAMQSVTSAAFAAKFRSKRGKYALELIPPLVEVFTFLTVDVKAYLPAFHTVTTYFLKDLISGKKNFVPMDQVTHVHVPFYENLKLGEIFNFFLKHEAVLYYLPQESELRKTPKQWICNVGATVLGEPFIAWIGDRIKARNEAVKEEKNMLISMDPAVAAAFHASTAVSRKYILPSSAAC